MKSVDSFATDVHSVESSELDVSSCDAKAGLVEPKEIPESELLSEGGLFTSVVGAAVSV